jgi:amino acid adenylation domain-containing protein
VRDPVSFAQEGLWVQEELTPDVNLYGNPVAVKLEGKIDVLLLKDCLTEISRRHDVLRSRISEKGGQLLAIVDSPAPVDIAVSDLRGLDASVIDQRLEARAREGFDLAAGPLLRAELFRVADRTSVLLLNVHHIVFDGWSLRLLWDELTALYASASAGPMAELPELPMRYTEFAAWQRAQFTAGRFQDDLAYWERQLAGAPTSLSLDAGRRRPGKRSYSGEDHRFIVPAGTRESITRLARTLNATSYMVMVSAWSVLLARHARQEDLLIGSPVAGRDLPEVENLIGLFVNTVLLRMRPGPDSPFSDLVAQTRQTVLEALTHQRLPFEKLAERMQAGRATSRNALFQTMFSYDTYPKLTDMSAGVAAVSLIDIPNGAAKFDLSATVLDNDSGMEIQLEYDKEVLDAGLIGHLGRQYLALLDEFSGNPAQRIGAAAALDESERRAVTRRFPGSPSRHAGAGLTTLHGMFEEQAARTPHAEAICSAGVSRSYADVNIAANRLAHYLKSYGVGLETPVAILLPSGPQWAIAILAVLKAGGVYLPLDPHAPAERAKSILASSGAATVIASELTAHAVPGDPVTVMVDAPEVRQELATCPGANPDSGVRGQNLAYVLYTSGSTGAPKGVMLTHDSLIAYCHSAAPLFGLTEKDRFLQLAPPTFDVHAEEIFPTWTAGGTVVFPGSESAARTPAGLIQTILELEVTICELPAAYWSELVRALEYVPAGMPSHLRRILVGGERISFETLAEWLRYGIPLINVYGLTETAITSTSFACAGEPPEREALPIGRPMSHAAVYVADDMLQPAGIGVIGEICIGGPGLARGYLNMPRQTALRFSPDPFGHDPGARLYRTGDIGRWLPDGNIEFLGRADNQVKIRGCRVEPGEVEAALERHPRVSQALVVADDAPAGGARLIAYAVGASIEPPELIRFLRSALPDYMIPAQIVMLDQLPVTQNGKVDKRALPVPAAPKSSGLPDNSVRGAVETAMAEIWAAVLEVPVVGAEDDFFELGGHSLIAIRLISKIQHELHVELALGDVFQYPTVRALSSSDAFKGRDD